MNLQYVMDLHHMFVEEALGVLRRTLGTLRALDHGSEGMALRVRGAFMTLLGRSRGYRSVHHCMFHLCRHRLEECIAIPDRWPARCVCVPFSHCHRSSRAAATTR